MTTIAVAKTDTSSTSVMEEFFLTEGTTASNNNNTNGNYNDHDDGETTTTDDDSNYDDDDDDDDDTISLSTAGTEIHKLPSTDSTDQQSTTSTLSTSSNPSSSLSYIDKLLFSDERIFHHYNDGDLQILNALVNKLHEADVARRRLEEEQLAREEQVRRNTTIAASATTAAVNDTTTVTNNKKFNYWTTAVAAAAAEQHHDCYEDDVESDWEEDDCSEGYRDGVIRHHYQLNSTISAANHHGVVSSTATTTTAAAAQDLPSEMPLHPPSFSPLTPPTTTTANNTNNSTTTTTATTTTSINNTRRELSISSVDSSLNGPSIEIVPTSQIQTLLPLWNQSWREEWNEWKLLHEESLRRKREGRSNKHGNSSKRGSGSTKGRTLRRSSTDAFNQNGGSSGGGSTSNNNSNAVRRNRSAPTKTSTTYQNRYGKPTRLNITPNPIVTKSSKKIHRRHARYALTAGMMLGVRESVGGANGVECELEAKMWEESELLEEEEERKRVELKKNEEKKKKMMMMKENEDERNEDVEKELNSKIQSPSQKKKQQQLQRIEVQLGPLKVTSTNAAPDNGSTSQTCCDNDNGSTSQTCCVSQQQFQEDDDYLTPQCEVVLGPLKVSSTVDTTPSTTNNHHHHHPPDNDNDNNSQSTQHKQQQDNYLTTQCTRISKYKFSPNTFYLGSNTSEPLPHKYKFKVYAPVVFQRIRTLFGVEKQTFLHSICGKFNLYEFASNAKSGQFFFYSHDGRYMIKTLTYTEQKFLRLILPAYYRHLTRYPHTFLTHFYGLYRVCMPNADNTRLHFVIMRSVFHTEKKIDRVWDLKGSTVGRKSGEGESVLKDLDILEEGKKLRFRNEREREAFMSQLEVDAAFLATMGIMDYSLLLGLHNDCGDDASYSSSVDGGGGVDEKITPRLSERKVGLDTGGGDLSSSAIKESSTEPPLPMTNTPHRRNVLMRKSIHGNGSSPPRKQPPPSHPKGGGGGRSSSSPKKSSTPPSSSLASNPITSMSDLGIQGGTPLRPETYYCGIIDILQYYNARKMGETVIKKAAGGDADNISCVDPETYGKRFIKFIGDLVE